MKLLTFLATRFSWKPHASALAGADPAPAAGEVRDTVVAFVHVEECDSVAGSRLGSLRQAQKHLEWLARKKGFDNVVLHSFAHLGGTSASPDAARAWIDDLGARLVKRGRSVAITPHGWTNAWELVVLGDAIAKVWKDNRPASAAPGDEDEESGSAPATDAGPNSGA